MGKPSAPRPPDPRETSAAQTGTSIATAIANAALNNVNQVGPDGTLDFSQTGEMTWTEPYTGKVYTIPRMTATTTLSPDGQKINDASNAAKLNLATLARDQSSFLNDYMAKPFDGSNDATESRLYELGRKRLDPMIADRRAALETQLSNQGIKLGSTAYDKAMELGTQGENDAYNNLLLSGHGQAFQEGQAIRNQPINEITALLSGSQVAQPQFGNFNQGTIPTTDNAGIINTNFDQKMNIWQQKMAQSQSILGGLFGLGSSLIGLSDRRLKKDVIRLAKTASGYFRYAFRFLWDAPDAPYHIGYMAQEVKAFQPSAVKIRHGYMALDYTQLEAV